MMKKRVNEKRFYKRTEKKVTVNERQCKRDKRQSNTPNRNETRKLALKLCVSLSLVSFGFSGGGCETYKYIMVIV